MFQTPHFRPPAGVRVGVLSDSIDDCHLIISTWFSRLFQPLHSKLHLQPDLTFGRVKPARRKNREKCVNILARNFRNAAVSHALGNVEAHHLRLSLFYI